MFKYCKPYCKQYLMFLLFKQKKDRIVATNSEGDKHHHLTQLQIVQWEKQENYFS